MPIKCNLSTLMGAKRVTIQDMSNNTGLARNTIAFLYHDKTTRVDYDTIDKLCIFLNCSVGDIFEYVPDSEGEV